MPDERIFARLSVIEDIVTRMDHRLFGNGQPGELDTLRHKVEKLESWLWRCIGGVAAVAFLVEVLFR